MDYVIQLLNRWAFFDERMEHKMSLRVANVLACSGCKENHFYSLPFGQAEASIY